MLRLADMLENAVTSICEAVINLLPVISFCNHWPVVNSRHALSQAGSPGPISTPDHG